MKPIRFAFSLIAIIGFVLLPLGGKIGIERADAHSLGVSDMDADNNDFVAVTARGSVGAQDDFLHTSPSMPPMTTVYANCEAGVSLVRRKEKSKNAYWLEVYAIAKTRWKTAEDKPHPRMGLSLESYYVPSTLPDGTILIYWVFPVVPAHEASVTLHDFGSYHFAAAKAKAITSGRSTSNPTASPPEPGVFGGSGAQKEAEYSQDHVNDFYYY